MFVKWLSRALGFVTETVTQSGLEHITVKISHELPVHKTFGVIIPEPFFLLVRCWKRTVCSVRWQVGNALLLIMSVLGAFTGTPACYC